jgi:transposase-like protein
VNLKEIHTKYNTQSKCVDYLEKLRWNGKIMCAYCGSAKTIPIKPELRHHCYDCKKSFSVTIGTIFEDTRYPFSDWFQMIWLVLNAKQGISAAQLHRTLECSYKTAWYVAMRMRCAMIDDCIELENIVEMDEAYIGGKPRKRGSANLSSVTTKRGRGTAKIPVVGIVERKGKVILKVIEKLTAKNLVAMLKDSINESNTIVITDEFKSYKSFDEFIQHLTIDHSKEYSKGIVHTNTIEGFWSIIKNSIRGQYISLSRKYLPLYLVQAQYIYNRRNSDNLFEEFLKRAMSDDKCMINYKPKRAVDKIVYKTKDEKKC